MSLSQPLASQRSVTGIPTGKLAVWWVIGSEIVIFGGLLACYITFRILHEEWSVEASHTNTLAGSLNTLVLLTSSLFVVLAHHSAEMQNHILAAKRLWLTIIFGAMFLCIKSIEWAIEISNGYVISKSVFWSFYYCAAGLHALHVIAGMLIMGIIARQAARGEHLQRVELIGLYWHFVDIVWIFLFPLLYIAK